MGNLTNTTSPDPNANMVLGEVFNQKVRIRPRISTGKFQGRYTKENQEWLEQNEGNIVNAYRDGLNYYKLESGFICHIYECSDVS